MSVLDAFAVIAFFRSEPARKDVEKILRAEDGCRLSAVNMAEVIDVLSRLGNIDPRVVSRQVDLLTLGGLTIEPANSTTASLAGEIRQKYYDRKNCAVSLADCFALATAKIAEEPLATADPALATITQAQNVSLIGLPNSAGKKPGSKPQR